MSFDIVQKLIEKIKQIISVIRFKPFDTTSAEGLSRERYRRAALTSITSIIAKGIGILTGLISVPLTLNYLGTERYGLWMTINSVVIMLAFADFGLGNGLVNAVSQAHGKDDRDALKKAVSSVFFMLLGSATICCGIFTVVYQFVPWPRIFNATSAQAIQESGPAVAVFFGCFALNLPLGIVQRIQLGYQEGFINNCWQITGNLLGLVAVVVAILLQAGLPWLVVALSGVPTLVTAVNWAFHFLYRRPWLLPRWSLFDWQVGKQLLGSGFIFMLLLIVNVLGTSADNIIIAQYMGASAVATYAVVQRLFSLTFLVQYCTSPLWPAFSEAFARSDFNWARRTFIHLQTLTVWMTVLICLPFLLFGQAIIKIWVGPLVIPSLSLLAGYTLYRLIAGVAEAAMPIMYTQLFIRRLLLVNAIAGIVTFILKLFFVQVWQVAGIAWAGALGYGLFYTLPVSIISYLGLRKASEMA